MARRLVWPKKKREVIEQAPPPPYLKDIRWVEGILRQDGTFKPPRKFGGGLSKRELALFLRRIDYDFEVVKAMFKKVKLSHEEERELFIRQMAFEFFLEEQHYLRPSWLKLQEYKKVRWRTLQEVKDDGDINFGSLNVYIEPIIIKQKKPTKHDILNKKYASLIRELKSQLED